MGMKKSNPPGVVWSKRRLFLRSFLAVLLLGGLALAALVVVVSASPATGSSGADILRSILGPQPVANMESVVFTVQDTVQHALFLIRGSTPSAPWQVYTPTASRQSVGYSPTTTLQVLPLNTGTPRTLAGKNTLRVVNSPELPLQTPPSPTPASLPTTPPTPTPWQPKPVSPMGQIQGEGEWEVFIQNPRGSPLAYRTFLQPDPARPYVTVAVVAFDLSQVQLHYQLGTEEPVSTASDPRTGQIPAEYRQAGVLLAAFNGGFKTIHGHYGVMVGSTALVPMIDGLGTLVIRQDGSLQMGEWDADLFYTPEIVIARQNCPLMVHNGEVNPLVNNDSVSTWGGTISGNTVTLRSGLGVSQDGQTLYYFAGSYLAMPVLAEAMRTAGAYHGMQLDINNYYVLFTKFEPQNDHLEALPLLPKVMVDNVGRFLGSYVRDFFFITTRQ